MKKLHCWSLKGTPTVERMKVRNSNVFGINQKLILTSQSFQRVSATPRSPRKDTTPLCWAITCSILCFSRLSSVINVFAAVICIYVCYPNSLKFAFLKSRYLSDQVTTNCKNMSTFSHSSSNWHLTTCFCEKLDISSLCALFTAFCTFKNIIGKMKWIFIKELKFHQHLNG